MKKKFLKDPDLANKYDFDVRKCVHMRLTRDTKYELDIMKKRLDLSLQEIFERLSQAIIDEDPYLITMLNTYRIEKQQKKTEAWFSERDRDSIYDILEQEDPLE